MATFLSVVFGLMGSGKSRRARALAEATKAVHISSDVTRKEMAKVPLTERAENGFGKGIYSSAFTDMVYNEMLNMARSCIEDGKAVVLDATYSKKEKRDAVRDAAREWGAPLFFFFVETSEEVIRQRLLRRETKRVVSDGRLDVFPMHRDGFEFPEEDENVWRIRGDGGVDASVTRMVAIIQGALKDS